MNNKAKGSRNERKTRDFFARQGYTVMKSGGSLGLFDLIAVNDRHLIFIQVKTNGWGSPAERDAIRSICLPANCIKQLWRWDDHDKEARVMAL